MTSTAISDVFRGETKGRKDFIKKVRLYRKDVGRGHEKEIWIARERKAAVKEAGMGAKAGLMG